MKTTKNLLVNCLALCSFVSIFFSSQPLRFLSLSTVSARPAPKNHSLVKELQSLPFPQGDRLGAYKKNEVKVFLESAKKASIIIDELQVIYGIDAYSWQQVCDIYYQFYIWDRAIETCKSYLEQAKVSSSGIEPYPWIMVSLAYNGVENYNKAVNYLEQGLKFVNSRPSNFNKLRKTTPLLSQLAYTYLQWGKYSEAVKYYQQVLKNEIELASPEVNDLRVFEARYMLGAALAANGDLAEAEKALLIAMQGFEEFQSIYEGDGVAVTLGEDHFLLYNELQKLYVKQGRYNKALEFSERGRTRALVKGLSGEYPSLTTQQIKELAQQKNITIVEYSIGLSYNQGSRSIKEDDLYIWIFQPNGQSHFRQVDLASLPINKSWLGLKFLSFSPLSLFILALGVYLSIFFLIKRSKNLALTIFIASCLAAIFLPGYFANIAAESPNQNNSLSSENLVANRQRSVSSTRKGNITLSDLTKATFATVKDEQRSVLSKSLPQGSCHQHNQCLEQLYQVLIEPIADLLPDNPEEQVVFVPHRDIFRVPFVALRDGKGQHLIEKHTIRTAPSIQVLQLTSQQAQQKYPGKKALVVGNPIMPKVSQATFEILDDSSLEQLSSLPGTEEEAQKVARILDTEPLIGKQATESVVIKQMPSANIIHLATHGVLDAVIFSIYQTESVLTLTASENYRNPELGQFADGTVAVDTRFGVVQTNQYDGLLTPQDIYSVDLNAELVVLSACDTGLGYISTDGVLSLARPFLVQGVPSVVVSLWKVPDAPTSELMVDFYNNLKSTPDKAQALRQAMLTTKEKYPEPVDWAAFTLVGEK